MLDMLKGTKVVSFNHFLMGPMGIQVLGDLGADVVAIETPEGAYQRHWSSGDQWCDGQGMLHLCANRNKRNIALDLKSAKGKEIAFKLIDGTRDRTNAIAELATLTKLGEWGRYMDVDGDGIAWRTVPGDGLPAFKPG